ncbi:MAG: hypothetical protein FJX00_00780 [Alphaproteobacteria bacterium]|nr:hypothetical protein [Alphaproteobacteria bacterium]
MNKKYILIALILYIFTAMENKATSNNYRKNPLATYEGSKQTNSFSLLDNSSALSQRSRSSDQKSRQKLKSLDLEVKASRITLVKNLMDMESVESISVCDSPSITLPKYKMRPEHTNQDTQTDQPAEKRDLGVQVSQETTAMGAERKAKTQNQETQMDKEPPAETKSTTIRTNSSHDSIRTTGSANTGRTESNGRQMVENLKNENHDRKDDNILVKTHNNQIEHSADRPAHPLSTKETQTTEEHLTKAIPSASHTLVSSPDQSVGNKPVTTHNHYYSTTNNHHTVNPFKYHEKSKPITAKVPDTLFDIDFFITNISNSIATSFSKDFPQMFSKFIHRFNEMTASSQKPLLKTSEEEAAKKAPSNKKTPANTKPTPQYTVFDLIKKQCTSLYDSLVELLHLTGQKKRVSRVSSEDSSQHPNLRVTYKTLGEDPEKPRRSTSSRLFYLSGKRAKKAITNSLSRVRRVVLDMEKISYNTINKNKRASRALKKTDQYAELAVKRSRIRHDLVTG